MYKLVVKLNPRLSVKKYIKNYHYYSSYIHEILVDELFINKIRHSKYFSETNIKSWNEGKFNSRKSIGPLMIMIKLCQPKNIHEWINYYLTNGKSVDELHDIAYRFKDYTNNKCSFYMSNEEAYIYVLIRVIYETFIGYQRETNTIYNLQNVLDGYKIGNSQDAINIFDSDIDLDYKFSVDCLLIKDNKAIAGIQIKSDTYKYGANDKIKNMNYNKQHMFTEKYGLPVFYAYASKDGSISNDIISEIKLGLNPSDPIGLKA